jgi:hypothetical protein
MDGESDGLMTYEYGEAVVGEQRASHRPISPIVQVTFPSASPCRHIARDGRCVMRIVYGIDDELPETALIQRTLVPPIRRYVAAAISDRSG